MRLALLALLLSGCFDGESQLIQPDIAMPRPVADDAPSCEAGVAIGTEPGYAPGYYCSGAMDGIMCLRSDYVSEPCWLGRFLMVRRCEECEGLLDNAAVLGAAEGE